MKLYPQVFSRVFTILNMCDALFLLTQALRDRLQERMRQREETLVMKQKVYTTLTLKTSVVG